MRTLTTFITLLAVLGLGQANESDTHANVAIYRGTDGQLTRDSLETAQQLQDKAKIRGYVTLWLTLNVPYNPNTHELSAQQIAEQNQKVRSKFSEILQPLINAGVVWHAAERPNVEGPGCLVRANATGLSSLVQDERLLHIHEVGSL